MRLRLLPAALAVAASSMLAGCTINPYAGRITSETTGSIGDAGSEAALGAAIGRNVEPGIVIADPGPAGNRIDASLDDVARQRYWDARNRALENGSSEEWHDGDHLDHGRVMAGRPYRQGQRLCRRYESTVWIVGNGEQLIGTACRNPDGTWSEIEGGPHEPPSASPAAP